MMGDDAFRRLFCSVMFPMMEDDEAKIENIIRSTDWNTSERDTKTSEKRVHFGQECLQLK